MIHILDRDLKIISRSKNLRGIMDYARNQQWCGKTQLEINPILPKELWVRFPGGATATVQFKSAQVLHDWIANRVKFGKGKFMRVDIMTRSTDPEYKDN